MLRLHDGGATLFTPTLLGNETRACTEVSLACLLLAFAWHFRESQPCWRSELRALRSHLHACMHACMEKGGVLRTTMLLQIFSVWKCGAD